MAMSAGTVSVSIGVDGGRDFAKAFQAAAAKVSAFSVQVNHALDKLATLENLGRLAVVGFSLKKAFDFAKEADSIADATKVLNYMGGSIESLKSATQGMLSDAQLTQQASFAAAVGLSSDQLTELSRVAVAASSTTGQDLTQALDAVVSGVARGNTRMLAQTGIMVDADEAAKKYAKAHGKLASSLTDTEKRQAVMNAVVEEGARLQKIAEESGAGLVNVFSQFESSAANMAEGFKGLFLPAMEKMLGLVNPLVASVAKFVQGMDAGDKALATVVGGVLAAVSAFTLLGPVIGGVVAALAPFAAPVLAVVAAVVSVAVAVGVMADAWQKNLGGVQDTARGLWKDLKEGFHGMVVDLTAGGILLKDALVYGFASVGQGMLEFLFAPVQIVLKGIDLLMKGFGGLFNFIGKGFRAAGMESEAKAFESAAKGMSMEGVQKQIEDQKLALQFKLDVAAPSTEKALAEAKTLVDSAQSALGNLAGTVSSAVGDAAGSIADAFKDKLKDAGRGLAGLLGFADSAGAGGKAAPLGGGGGTPELSEAAKKARASLDELAASLERQATLGLLSGPQQEVLQGALELHDAIRKAAALVAQGGDPESAVRVQRAGQAAFEQTINKQLQGAATLDEYNKILATAKEAAGALGVSFKAATKTFEQARPTNTTELFAPIAAAMAGFIGGKGKNAKDTADLGAALAPAMGGLLEGSGGPLAAALPKIFGQVIGSAGGPISSALTAVFSSAGPAGGIIAGAVSSGVQAIFGMLVDGFKQVVDFMVNAAQQIPQMISDQANKLGALIPSDKVQKFIQAAFNPIQGQAVLMAGVFAALGGVVVALTPVWYALASVVGMAAAFVGAFATSLAVVLAPMSAMIPLWAAVAAVSGVLLAAWITLVNVVYTVAAAIVGTLFAHWIGALVLSAATLGTLYVAYVGLIATIGNLGIAMVGLYAAVVTVASTLAVAVSPVGAAIGTLAVAVAPLVPIFAALQASSMALAAVFMGPLVAAFLALAATVTAATGALAAALMAPVAALGIITVSTALLAGALAAVSAATVGLALGFFKLAADTESFKRLGEAFEASMGRVVKALEPFFDNLMPLAGLFDALMSVLIPLAASFAANEQMGRVLFDVFKVAALGVGVGILAVGLFVSALTAGVMVVGGALKTFALAIDQTLDGVLFLFASLTDMLGGNSKPIWDVIGQKPDTSGLDALQEAARNMSPDIDSMAQALRDIENLTYEEADARARSLLKTKEASEELTNIPQGFKVVAARFRAITAENRGGTVAGAGGGGGGRNFYIDNMSVMAEDVGSFADSLEREAERRSFQQTGTTGTRDGQNNGNN